MNSKRGQAASTDRPFAYVSLWACSLFVSWLLCTPVGAQAEMLSGRVVVVLDGDTIEVVHNNRNKDSERIRLNGIDCPEKGQAYGNKAKQATSQLVLGKAVSIQTHGVDTYGLTMADVFLPDGMNVNLELVRNGWCWWYQQYAPDNVIFAELQRRARRAGIGLWADPRPVPPWEWRKRNGGALKQRAVSN